MGSPSGGCTVVDEGLAERGRGCQAAGEGEPGRALEKSAESRDEKSAEEEKRRGKRVRSGR